MTSSTHGLEFILEHRGFVRALARDLVFDPDLARDVEQETWLAALSNAPRNGSSPRAWLAGIVRKVALKAWRSKLRRGDRELAVARAARTVATPVELLERESLRREIVEAVVALDEPWRAALIARYFDELSPQQAARQLALPLETLRTRLKRGRELLRERLKHRSGESGRSLALALVGAWRLEPPSYAAVARSLLQEVLIVSAVQKTIAAITTAVVLVAALWMWESEPAVQPQLAAGSSATSDDQLAPLPGSSGVAADSVRARAPLPVANEVPTPPSAESRFGSLRLHVVWAEDKSPAAGVWMRLFQRGADDPYRDTQDACTDPAGEVLVERVFAGRVAVKFDRGARAELEVEGARENSATLEIPGGFAVVGTVVDIDGRPFADAAIYAQAFGGSYEGFVVGRSAGDGSFSIRALAARTSVSISALAAGRTPTRQHVCMAEPGATITLRLAFESPGGAVNGRVLAFDGSPIAGARVLIGPDYDASVVPLGDGTFGRPPPSQLAHTDERGQFSIDGLPPGLQPLQARASGFAPWKGQVAVFAGRTSSVDVALLAGTSLSGVVRDEAGMPLAGVDVWANTGVVFAATCRRTRTDGSFAMRELPLGELSVEADGGERGYAQATLFAVAGGELRWDPVLSSGARLRVQLVAPGRELAGWRITVEQQPSQIDGYADTKATDADGRVEFLNVPDVELRLCLRARGSQLPRAVLHGVRTRDGEVAIEPDPALEPTSFLRGRVVDPEGKPCGGVSVSPVNPRLFYPPYAVTAAATGRFEFGPLPAGEWSVHGSARGFARLRSTTIRVDAGAIWDFGDLQLQRGGTVVARIAIEGAASDARPTVVLRDAAGELDALVVEGDFARSSPVPAGRYTLIASANGMETLEIDVDVLAGLEKQIAIALRKPQR